MNTTARVPPRCLGFLLLLSFACGEATEPRSQPGPPAQIQVVSGDLQPSTVGQELAQPLVVRVADSVGVPVAGQIVNWRVTAGDGSVFAGAAITDAAGEARER